MKRVVLALIVSVLALPVASATTQDFSGNGFDLATQGSPTLIESGSQVTGKGYDFDGSDCMLDGLEAADKTGSASYYVLVNNDVGGTTISASPTGAGGVGKGVLITNAPASVTAFIGTGDGSYDSLNHFHTEDGPLSFLITFNGATDELKIYLNGTEVASQIMEGPIDWTDDPTPGWGPSPAQFYVGARRGNTAGTACDESFATGQIYEVRTYGRVLSAAEAVQLADCEQRELALGGEVRFYHFGLTEYGCPAPTASGGSFFGSDGLFYGGDKSSFAATWKLTEAALDAMYGVLVVLIFAGIAYQVAGESSGVAIGGAAAGMLFAFAFGLFSVWVGVFFVVVGLAVAFLRRSMAGGAMDG